MSGSAGTQQIISILKGTFLSEAQKALLVAPPFRQSMDSMSVIVGISITDLMPNSSYSKAEFEPSYLEFIDAIFSYIPINRQFNTYKEAYTTDKLPPGVLLIRNPSSLRAINFSSIRSLISNVSKLIPHNKYFGTTKRYVSSSEFGSRNPIEAAKSAEAIRKKYEYASILNEPDIDKITLFKQVGKDSTWWLVGPNGNRVLSERSVIDIGHLAYGTDTTPLLRRINSILNDNSGTFSSTAVSAANKARQDIVEAHTQLAFTFENTSININNISGHAELVLTLQHYKLNNILAAKESKVYREMMLTLAKELAPHLLNISGSNTIKQDIVFGLSNILKGINTRLPKHGISKGKLVDKRSIPSKRGITTPFKATTPSKIQFKSTTGQFYSLTSLQMLINTHLQDVVSANMGNGGSRDVLNYRTGRFAASVKVERLTQSREGMISAFYNYMRNPYQTFEPGYKMGSPKTRDPKLLIAKSIKEIAATKVGNRMRAVLI